MKKQKFIKACERIMLERLKKDASVRACIGTPLERQLVLRSLSGSLCLCRSLMNDLNESAQFELNEHEIEEVLNESYRNIRVVYASLDWHSHSQQMEVLKN
ncbi:hypothetical protein [Robertkochia aurantiaca]|uniref:hypothetical protein n=1 Tax=Robertkochia aurantiaca TaxID=2873700 RepID=UPI001CCF670E|nr:hypothetical protein [Robertkochia sp. 3YJGBD-33]